MHRPKNSTAIAVFTLGLFVLFSAWQTALAGPITNGPGVAPFVKLGVYQGVISVVPGGATDSILEIGNAGRDIASTGAIYLRPGTIGGQSGSVVFSAQSTPNEGAELTLLGAGAFQPWVVDLWQNRFRVYTAGTERFVIDGTAGNIYVPTGSICYGNVGSTNCLTVGGGPGTTPTLDAVLGAGNTGNAKRILLNNQPAASQAFGATSGASLGAGSYAFLMPYAAANGSYSDVTRQNDSGLFFNPATGLTISGWNASGAIKGIRVGGAIAASAALAVNNNLAGTGSGGDGLAIFSNTANSAIYAQQDNAAGYAAYFTSDAGGNATTPVLYARNNASSESTTGGDSAVLIGEAEIRMNAATTSPTWDQADVLKVVSDVNPTNWVGSALHAVNKNSAGFAGYFQGQVTVDGMGGFWTGSCPSTQCRLGALVVRNTYTGGFARASGNAVFATAGLPNGSFQVDPGTGVLSSVGVWGNAYSAVPGGQYSIGVAGITNNTAGTIAGYFRGYTVLDGPLSMGGKNKSSSTIMVCKSDDNSHCVGPYVRTSGSTTADLRLHYLEFPANVVKSVLMFRTRAGEACPATSTQTTRQTTGVTYFTGYDCESSGSDGYVSASSPTPFGNGEGVCVSNGTQTQTYHSRRTDNFKCQNFVDNSSPAFTFTGRAIIDSNTANGNGVPATNTVTQDYELR